MPQNFSDGESGLPHELQSNGATGGSTLSGGRGTGDGCGGSRGIMTGAGAGMGSGTGLVTCAGAGTGVVVVSSSWDAPQFRQNFAFGATAFPHSGQNGILISTEWLNVVHKEYFIFPGKIPAV